jgi:hypothetical protein
MNRQNLFSGTWDGENEEAGTRQRIFWRPDDAKLGATLYEFAPTRPTCGCTCTSGPKRCSSS